MSSLATYSCKTPLGALSLISDDEVILAAGFINLEQLRKKLSISDQEREWRAGNCAGLIPTLISDYFDGNLNSFTALKVRQPGSSFSQSTWKAMRKIRAGTVLSYAELAARIGAPRAVRAVGTICAKNAIAPIIPCHRIVKTGGAVGNYGYGTVKKEWLLRHEGVI